MRHCFIYFFVGFGVSKKENDTKCIISSFSVQGGGELDCAQELTTAWLPLSAEPAESRGARDMAAANPLVYPMET